MRPEISKEIRSSGKNEKGEGEGWNPVMIKGSKHEGGCVSREGNTETLIDEATEKRIRRTIGKVKKEH
jgi:hypothetical protein